MDWQTKEYIDSRFDELDEKIDAIMQHLKVPLDDELDQDEEGTEVI